MPKLKPFQPVRYAAPNSGSGKDMSTRIAPPYDVLDEGPKQALLARDAHNIVAIDLPVTPPKTVGPDEAYAKAGKLYRQWLADGTLIREDEPAIVAYEQEYQLNNQTVKRRGLFAVLGVEEFNRPNGGIFRHEMTIAGGIGDRTKLMAATSAQLSPIFGIFPDPHTIVADLLAETFDTPPDFQGVTANDGVTHRCWLVTDMIVLSQLTEFFHATDVFIADGHHRYTTALEFAKAHPELPEADGCLFVLVAAEDPGMVVLPTHRIVCGMQGFSLDKLREVLTSRSDLWIADEVGSDQAPFQLYDPATGQMVSLQCDSDPLAATHPDRPKVWRTLDVAILQHLIVEQVLQPAFAPGSAPLTVKYTADAEEMKAIAKANQGLGILMRSTPLESVMAVSQANDVMPPKSTYFYPKLATGLVINPLD